MATRTSLEMASVATTTSIPDVSSAQEEKLVSRTQEAAQPAITSGGMDAAGVAALQAQVQILTAMVAAQQIAASSGLQQVSTNSAPTIKLPSGNLYTGDMKDGKPHGKGTLIYPRDHEKNRDRYDGEFQDGYMHGRGVLTWTTGERYNGEFVQGLRSGKGTMKYANVHESYTGDWFNDKINGQGTQTWYNGSHSGAFLNGVWHGAGEQFQGRTSERGVWVNGKKNGDIIFNCEGYPPERRIYVNDVRMPGQEVGCGACVVL
jgi:hypothetical protein